MNVISSVTGGKKCFIITPFGKEGSNERKTIDGINDLIIKPVLTECGYSCEFPGEILIPGEITNQIVLTKYQCDFIICNLTALNPNVIYELALADAFLKPVIIITDNTDSIPFDFHSKRAIRYTNDLQGGVKLRSDLLISIEHLDFLKPYTDNIVFSAINGYNIAEKIRKNKPTNELLYILDEIQNIKRSIDSLNSFNDNSKKISMFNEIYDKLNDEKLNSIINTSSFYEYKLKLDKAITSRDYKELNRLNSDLGVILKKSRNSESEEEIRELMRTARYNMNKWKNKDYESNES